VVRDTASGITGPSLIVATFNLVDSNSQTQNNLQRNQKTQTKNKRKSCNKIKDAAESALLTCLLRRA
jgi:hypothetical protein